MPNTEVMQVVAFDLAPYGSICEWCGQPAEQLLTVLDGSLYNDSSCFCRLCGEALARTMAYSLKAEARTEEVHAA